MKKSLTLLLAIAMVFSMFSAVAFADTAPATDEPAATEDTAATTELTAQQKFDQLKEAGIFEGDAEGNANLDQNMTRAQFAVVVAKLLGLDTTNPPATATFSDVNSSHWAFAYVEAAAEKNYFEGYKGAFNDKGNVTVQELAIVLVKVLGLSVEDGATVEGASPWAAGYVAAAIKAGLIPADASFTAPATREQLVNSSYAANEAIKASVVPDKASVTKAEATGVRTVQVTLDKAVDTAKATFTLKKDGASNIALNASKTVWSEDGKTATLTLDGTRKIQEGEYTVTLGGLAEGDVAQASATFKAQDETVQKIEFVTTSDEIASTNKAKVKVKAENQYGENASFGAADFTVSTDARYNATIKKENDGYLYITMNTSVTKTTTGLTQGLTMIPVYVYYNDTHLTAQKTFKLGFTPFISKMEIGEVAYTEGSALTTDGDKAIATVTFFDQYGNPIVPGEKDSTGTEEVIVDSAINTNITPYSDKISADVDTTDDGEAFELKVTLNEKEDAAGKYSVNVYAGSASDTVAVEVGSAKVVTKIQIEGVVNGETLAHGDTGKYVSLLAYDANGDLLTGAEIADDVNSDPDDPRIKLTINGADSATIVKAGSHQGQVKLGTITAPDNGYVFLTASVLSQNVSSFDTIQIAVNEDRIPDSIVLKEVNDPKALATADSDFEFDVLDQYGEKMDDVYAGSEYYVDLSVTGSVYADVVSQDGGAPYGALTTLTDFNKLNNGHTFIAKATGKTIVKATLYKEVGVVGDKTDDVEIDNASTDITTINPATTTLKYALNTIGSLYNSVDDGVITDENVDGTTGTDSKKDPTKNHVAKEVTVKVTDNSGDTVAHPDNILAITSSNSSIVLVKANGSQGFALGNKAGTATVSALISKFDGESVNLTAEVTVKNDAVSVASISADDDNAIVAYDGVDPLTKDLDLVKLMDLEVKDNYGIKYDDLAEVRDYNALLGINYAVSDVYGATVTINQADHTITVTEDLDPKTVGYEFVVTATAPNGKSAATLFHN